MDTSNTTVTIKCWVELYSDSMYSWALYKTASKETAEDLVQETFLIAVQSFSSFEGKSNPKTWLMGILNNKINNYYRQTYRNPTVNDSTIFEKLFTANDQWKPEEQPRDWTEETAGLISDSEFTETLNKCLGNLPSNWFSAIQLKYLEDKKGELICQELGITPTNFWQILHRAKLQLRKCLEVNWFKKQDNE